MDQIAIQIVELQTLEARLERARHALGTVIVVPELRGDEQLLPSHGPAVEGVLQRASDDVFVAVELRAIQMPEPHLQGARNRLPGCERVQDQGSEADGRHGARSMSQRQPFIVKRI
jgi:hypothetical protein